MAKSCIILGDIHYPFSNSSKIKTVIAHIKKVKPHNVVQIGDLYDFYSWSKFPNKRDVYTPEAEIGLGRELAEEMWARVRKASPKSSLYQLKGNHDERPYKRLLEKNPELFSITSGALDELFKFPGVSTQRSEREELLLDNVMYMHGYRSKLGDHVRHNNVSTVVGHAHRGGCVFIRSGDKIIWELNAGYLADCDTVPMSYTRQRTISQWTTGFGEIDRNGWPSFRDL